MGSYPFGYYFEPGKAFMRGADFQFRWFGDDGRVRTPAFDNGRGTDARVFLIYNGGDDHIAAQSSLFCCRARRHNSRQAAFHVECSPSVQAVILYIGVMRPLHTNHSDSIHVRIEQQ